MLEIFFWFFPKSIATMTYQDPSIDAPSKESAIMEYKGKFTSINGEKIAIIHIKILGLIIEIRKPSVKLNLSRFLVLFSCLDIGFFLKNIIEKYNKSISPLICNNSTIFGKIWRITLYKFITAKQYRPNPSPCPSAVEIPLFVPLLIVFLVTVNNDGPGLIAPIINTKINGIKVSNFISVCHFEGFVYKSYIIISI